MTDDVIHSTKYCIKYINSAILVNLLTYIHTYILYLNTVKSSDEKNIYTKTLFYKIAV